MAIAALALLAAGVQAQDRPLPDRDTFIAETRKRLGTDQALQSRYAFVETRRTQKLDDEGRPTEESVKVFENHPGVPGEGRWERLIAEDGRRLTPEELAEQDRERQRKIQDLARRAARRSPRDREKQAREWEKYQRERVEAIDDVFRVYDVRMLGRERVEGVDTIAFALTPRPDAEPTTDDGEMMQHFKVQAWVSEADYELVRVEAEAIDTVTIGFGLLARVHPGSKFSFLRRKVNGEVWLPARTSYAGSARVGLVKVMRRQGSSEFSEYRKVPEAAVAAVPPASGSAN